MSSDDLPNIGGLRRQASGFARNLSTGFFSRIFGRVLPKALDEEAQQENSSEHSQPELRPESAQEFTATSQLRATLFNSPVNILLLAVPAGIALHAVASNPIAIFTVNFVGIIPLAAILSYATEEIALRTGETIGGLLNASFGNAVEFIVAIIALTKKDVLIVQTSLVGSILSNLLLVMGMCFFFGGVGRLEQHFDKAVAQTAAKLLVMAVGSLIIPTAFHLYSKGNEVATLSLSRGTSVLMLLTYGFYLFFSLASHRPTRDQSPKNVTTPIEQDDNSSHGRDTQLCTANSQVPAAVILEPANTTEQPQLKIWFAFMTLAVSTVLVAVCAEFMVDSINALTVSGTPSPTFVGLVLLPIVGNAAEHATAVIVARKGKMDLAIAVAVGSSLQIALLVLPTIVVLGWMIGVNMPLNLELFEVILLFVSVWLVHQLISDGKSHWFDGVLPMILYLIVSIAAWWI